MIKGQRSINRHAMQENQAAGCMGLLTAMGMAMFVLLLLGCLAMAGALR